MKYVSIMGIALALLAMVNYFGITIFYHRYAEGQHMRSGIARAIVPGSIFLLVAGLWHLVRYIRKDTTSYWALAYFILSYGVIIFRQTRSKIIALSTVVMLLLMNNRRYGVLGSLLVTGLVAGAAVSLVMEENILIHPFQSAYTDIMQGTGTWGARAEVMRKDLEDLGENLYYGNAALVLREGAVDELSLDKYMELEAAAKISDIGYVHFVKFFGLPGILWMLAFIFIFYRRLYRYLKDPGRDATITRFAGYMFTFIVIAEITLDFFLSPPNILILYLVVVMLLNSRSVSVE